MGILPQRARAGMYAVSSRVDSLCRLARTCTQTVFRNRSPQRFFSCEDFISEIKHALTHAVGSHGLLTPPGIAEDDGIERDAMEVCPSRLS